MNSTKPVADHIYDVAVGNFVYTCADRQVGISREGLIMLLLLLAGLLQQEQRDNVICLYLRMSASAAILQHIYIYIYSLL